MTNYSSYLKNWLRWQPGRQSSDYDKLLVLANPFLIPFDCYLLRFPVGSEIAPHQDTVASGRHFRLNIVLKHAASGGQFECANTLFESPRIKLFRPDEQVHSVTRVVSGTRYVLSLGWVLK